MSGRVSENSVRIGDYVFPTYDTIRRTVVTPFAPKFTIGESTRDDDVVKSTWVLSDFSGGAGILYGNSNRHAQRFWWADGLDTKYQRALTLGPEIVTASTSYGPISIIADLNESLYAVDENNNLLIWDESGAAFTDTTENLSGTPHDVVLYQGELLFGSENGIDR